MPKEQYIEEVLNKFDKEFKSGSCTCDTVCGIWETKKYHAFISQSITQAVANRDKLWVDELKKENIECSQELKDILFQPKTI